MRPFLANLLRDRTGGTAIEYGLLLAVFATLVLFSVNGMATSVLVMWTKIQTKTSEAMAQH